MSDVVPDRPGGEDGRDTADVPFVGAARLELDELLEQLVDRIHDVQRTQGRLRSLLRANLAIAHEVDLEHVLRHIVSAARSLVDARYAALGVIQDGQLVRFLHEGMAAEVVAEIGGLPEGKGLLGALVEDPHPVRIPEICEHAASVGFPAGHPPMHSFLGVPIRVRDQVFGNLYLTEKRTAASFSRDDEEVVKALAGAAGLAIENAMLFTQAQRRRDWQEAMTGVTTSLLEGADRDQALRSLVERALRAAGADGAAFTCPPDEQRAQLQVAVAVGLLEQWHGQLVPPAGTLAETVLQQRSAALIADPATDPRTERATAELPQLGSVMAAPVVGESRVYGVLTLCHRRDAGVFTAADRDLISAFATHAGLVLDVAELRRDNERVRALEDRQQIAEDLQQTLIRDLFSLGLSLHGAASRIPDSEARTALMGCVDELDRIIRGIRTAVFAMEPRHPSAPQQ